MKTSLSARNASKKTDISQYTPFYVDDEWYKNIKDRHKSIRKLFGGIDFKTIINIEKEEFDIEGLEESNPSLIREIISLSDFSISKEDLISGYVNLNNKKISVGKFLSRKFPSNHNLSSALSDFYNEKKYFSCEPGKYYINISTDPISFLKLGHFECDPESCFRDSVDKLRLAESKNSFVATVNDGEYGRCWGMMNDRCNGFFMTNAYTHHISHETLFCCVRKSFEQILNKQLVDHDGRCDDISLYLNRDKRCFRAKGSKSNMYFNDDSTIESDYCLSCRVEIFNRDLGNGSYCNSCKKDLLICPITKKYFHPSNGMDHFLTRRKKIRISSDTSFKKQICNECYDSTMEKNVAYPGGICPSCHKRKKEDRW